MRARDACPAKRETDPFSGEGVNKRAEQCQLPKCAGVNVPSVNNFRSRGYINRECAPVTSRKGLYYVLGSFDVLFAKVYISPREGVHFCPREKEAERRKRGECRLRAKFEKHSRAVGERDCRLGEQQAGNKNNRESLENLNRREILTYQRWMN